MPPAMRVRSSGFGAAGASTAEAGLAGAPGAVGAVAEVTFVASDAGETVGGAFDARTAAGRICGRAAVGCAVIWLGTGLGARKWPIAATASPDAMIARV